MDRSSSTYGRIGSQAAMLLHEGRTAEARKLLKRGLRKARFARDKGYIFFFKAMIARHIENDHRSAFQFHRQALRMDPRNLLFLKSVEAGSRMLRQMDDLNRSSNKDIAACHDTLSPSRKRAPNRLYCLTYEGVERLNRTLALEPV